MTSQIYCKFLKLPEVLFMNICIQERSFRISQQKKNTKNLGFPYSENCNKTVAIDCLIQYRINHSWLKNEAQNCAVCTKAVEFKVKVQHSCLLLISANFHSSLQYLFCFNAQFNRFSFTVKQQKLNK